MASSLTKTWVYATVPIDNPQGESGTGFLVCRMIDENQARIFLVTNKHVVHRDAALRPQVTHLTCHFNTVENDGSPGTAQGDIPLIDSSGVKHFREHLDPDTDVCALDVTDVIGRNPSIQKKWVKYDMFGDAAKRNELDITIAEEVVTIGYPLGLRQGASNFPLVRKGWIATTIGTLFHDKVKDASGGLRDRIIRAFLIDGATVPGSSGSPVVLNPVIGRQVGNEILLSEAAPPVLLGIVGETTYAPIDVVGKAGTFGFAGLGLAFDVETIRETIELFFS